MDLTPYVNQLRNDLLTAASVGSDETRRAAALLAGALEPATRLAMMNALSDLAAEITAALRDTSVSLRLDGGQVRLAVDRHGETDQRDADDRHPFSFVKQSPRHPSGARTAHDDQSDGAGTSPDDLKRAVQDAGGELSRTTVRLFNELKAQAERAAADQGMSLNTYISRAVADSVRTAVPHKHGDPAERDSRSGESSGHRRTVTGFVQA